MFQIGDWGVLIAEPVERDMPNNAWAAKFEES